MHSHITAAEIVHYGYGQMCPFAGLEASYCFDMELIPEPLFWLNLAH